MKKISCMIVVSLLLIVMVGCDAKPTETDKPSQTEETTGTEKESEPEKVSAIMNLPFEKVASVTRYTKDSSESVSKESEEFLSLAEAIERAEGKANESAKGKAWLIDGGIMTEVFELKDGEYSVLCAKYGYDIYIVKPTEPVSITYSDFESTESQLIALYVIPGQGEFGAILDNGHGGLSGCPIADVEKNIFAR